jgi:signal transduction histidine kinase
MNKTQVRQGTVTLRNVVDSNIQLLQKSASDKSIKVIQNINEKVKLWADKHHVDIIIRNLLSNAIKFTPENGLITLEVFDAKDGFWELHIKDTGIGLEASVIDSILNTNRVHSTYGTQNEKGTGIGLSLCLDMVTRNGGEMTVASEPGKGSTFMVKLPAKLGRTVSKPISNQTVN